MKCSVLVVGFVCLTLCHTVACQNGYSNDVPQVPFGYNGNGGNGPQQQFGPDDGYQYGDNGQNGNSMIGSIPGRAGEDYPIYATPPETAFKCDDYEFPGYYADPEAQCQVFHICQTGNRKDSFLCPNGTLFNQQFLVCDWWNHVDCNRAQEYYSVNQYVYQEMQAATQRLLFEQARRAQQALDQGYSYNAPQNGEGYSNGNGNQNGNTNGNQNGGYSNRNGGYSNGNGNQNAGYSNGNGNQNAGYSNGNGNQNAGYSNGNGNQNGGYTNGNGNGYTTAQSTSYLPPSTNGNRNGNGNGNRNGYSNGNGNRNGYSRANGNRNNYSNSREYLPPQ